MNYPSRILLQTLLTADILRNSCMQDSIRGEVSYARLIMEHIHADIEHIKADHLKEHRECAFVPELGEHVKDLDNHLHEILAHVERDR